MLEELVESGALENVKRQEARIREAVAKWDLPVLDSLRGVGLMLGFVLNIDEFSGTIALVESGQTPSLYVVNKAMDEGFLTVPAGDDVVRWLPPLNVSDAEVDEALATFSEVLSSL